MRGRAVGVATGRLKALADGGDQVVLVPGFMRIRVGGPVEVVFKALLVELEAHRDLGSIKVFSPSFLTGIEHAVDVHLYAAIVGGEIMRDKQAPDYPEGATQVGRLFTKVSP